MKKSIICLLLAALITAVLPAQAMAAGVPASNSTGTPIGYEVNDSKKGTISQSNSQGSLSSYYGYNALCDMEEDISSPGVMTGVYECMFAAANAYSGNADRDTEYGLLSPWYSLAECSLFDLPDSLMELIFQTMRNDHPELFWLRNVCRFAYDDSGENVTAFALCFYEYTEGFSAVQKAFEEKAGAILARIPECSPYETEFHIHNTLLEQLSYTADNSTDQSAYAALVSGYGSSAGYAAAFQYLLQQKGIGSFTVTGGLGDTPHVWNMVQLDDNWYFVDPALDDPIVQDGFPVVNHDYFNVGTAAMEASLHEIDNERNVPSTYDNEYFDHTPSQQLCYHNLVDISPDTHTLYCRYENLIIEAHRFGAQNILAVPTCTEEGSYSQTCEVCAYQMEGTLPPQAHHYNDGIADENERITYTCTECSNSYSRSAFSYRELNENAIAVIGYEGIHGTDIAIPAEIDGFTVTEIGGGAFQDRHDLKRITIPYGITAIDEYAFSGCDNLTVHYGGNEDQWKQINIASHNEGLDRATVHFEDTRLLLDIESDNATVQLSNENGTFTFTNSGEWYTMEQSLPAGIYTLRAEKEGYVPYQREIVYEGKGALLSFRLLRPGNINGEGGDAADAVDMQQMYGYLIGTVTITDPYLLQVADVNGDNAVDVYDLQRLYEAVSEIRAF